MTDLANFLMRTDDGRLHEPELDADGVELCPLCRNDDLSSWADDGEADAADWFECDCGAHGAYVRRGDPSLTQNGLRLDDLVS